MRIKAILVGLGIASGPWWAPRPHRPCLRWWMAPTAKANGITTVLFCDKPMQPDGSWIECSGFYPFASYGDYRSIGVRNDCFPYDSASPPSLSISQPNHHIDF